MSDNKKENVLDNQEGFVLVLSMLIMVVLIVIGVTSIKTSRVELEIAGNEKFHQQTFYEAESGISISKEAIRLNHDENPSGFTPNRNDNWSVDVTVLADNNTVAVVSPNLWQNTGAIICPTDANRDIYFPYNYDDTDPDNVEPHTNITATGRTVFGVGGALQMSAGYEGVGKGSAAGGSHKLYDIVSQRSGYRKSESTVQAEWRFVP